MCQYAAAITNYKLKPQYILYIINHAALKLEVHASCSNGICGHDPAHRSHNVIANGDTLYVAL